MKHNFVSVVVLCLGSLAAVAQMAQTPHILSGNPEHYADTHIAALDRRVHLTDDQKAKLRPVFMGESNRMIAIANNTAMQSNEKRTAALKVHTDTVAKINEILTPEQRKLMPQAPTSATASPNQN